jgi:Uma2 family endonuclease
MVTAELPTEQHLVLHCISWNQYLGMGDLLLDHHVRLTYDRGALEFMTLSPEHERGKHLLSRMVEALADELDIDIAGYGSMTCRREDLERGLEPDECYWIEREAEIRDRTVFDLAVDPPPDLVLEVEYSRSILNRLGIYAALGVPEVWRWDGTQLRVLLLGADGRYAESDRSRSFSFLPLADFARFLGPDVAPTETKRLRAFRAWVREEASGWQRTGPA